MSAGEKNTAPATAALAYAARGWHVFPCKPDKAPYTSRGVYDATTDAATIRRWWSQWPAAAIGLACGASGLFVIDCDVKNGIDGIEAFEALGIAHTGALHSRTPSGGLHIVFRANGAHLGNSAGKLAPGVDTRGEGGYIIAPPSNVTGGAYTALDDWQSDPSPIPAALVALLKPRQQKKRAPAPGSNGRGLSPWAAKALQDELDAVARASEGTRNETLNKAAFNLGQLVGGQELDMSDVTSGLLSAAIIAGLGEREAQRTIDSGLAAGLREPRHRPASHEASIAGASRLDSSPVAIPEGHYNLTDLGNAQRLIARYGSELRYCYPLGTWYVYDGRRWTPDQRGEVERRAKATVRAIYAEAATITDDAERRATVDHARRSEARGRLVAMIELARSEPGVAVLPCEFDASPWLLNCANGTLDLRTGILRPHDKADLITKLAPVNYVPGARLALWENFLEQATGGNAELAAFIQRAVGYTLTGDTSEEVLFFVHGPQATGKSTLLEALKATLGDYATTADFETFLKRSFTGGGPRPDVARLAGARLVASLEVDEGKVLAEGLIKQLTGGDTVTARELYAKAFEFRPAFKLWLAANHAPKINADDGAMWRRILKLPFEHGIPEQQRDPLVKATLRDPEQAGPAILAWALAGCLQWQREGLGTCPAVEQATAALKAAMDPLADFLEQCTVMHPQAWSLTGDLRSEYEAWCRETGEIPVNGHEFTRNLAAHGCVSERRYQGRGWRGIGLRAPEDEHDA